MYVRLEEEEIRELLVDCLQKKVEKGKVSCEIRRGRDRKTSTIFAVEGRREERLPMGVFLYVVLEDVEERTPEKYLQKNVEKGKVSCGSVPLCQIRRDRDRKTSTVSTVEGKRGER
jgi:hypothetical protein